MVADHKPKMVVQTLKIDSDLLLRLKIHAARTSASQQDILHAALVEYLNRREKKEK
jgi:predicted transcriptional regulator